MTSPPKGYFLDSPASGPLPFPREGCSQPFLLQRLVFNINLTLLNSKTLTQVSLKDLYDVESRYRDETWSELYEHLTLLVINHMNLEITPLWRNQVPVIITPLALAWRLPFWMPM